MSSLRGIDKRIAVWLIEDSTGLRDTMADILGQTPDLLCSGSFSSMEQVIEMLESSEIQAPDVVILDLGLPGIGGLEGIPLLKTRFSDCEILIFTVYEDKEKIASAIGKGASGYLLKTEKLDRIPAAIREACSGGGPLSPIAGRALVDTFRTSTLPQHDYGLTPREIDVLRLMTKGLGKKEVADELSLSYHTVDCYIRGVYKKLGVNSIHGAVGKALSEHIL